MFFLLLSVAGGENSVSTASCLKIAEPVDEFAAKRPAHFHIIKPVERRIESAHIVYNLH